MNGVPCVACGRDNTAARKFCGGCGAALAVACSACGYANQGVDRFCGGCGAMTREATVPAKAAKSATGSGAIDLEELFHRAGEVTSELPRIGIAQDDLDKLFGGGS